MSCPATLSATSWALSSGFLISLTSSLTCLAVISAQFLLGGNDLGAFGPDDNARTGGADGDFDACCGTLDFNAVDAGVFKFFLKGMRGP